MHRALTALAVVALAAIGAGCPTDPVEAPVFPRDFLAMPTWRQTRDCRPSHDHELRWVRTWGDEGGYAGHLDTDLEIPFVEGSTLVKGEYDSETCAEESLLEWTAMQKLAAGEDPGNGDWHWQRVTADYRVVDRNDEVPARCVTCHEFHCFEPPYGNDMTCADEAPEPPEPR